MPVALREVFAHFGITTDDRKLKQLDNSVEGMLGRLRSLGAVLTGGAVVYGLRSLVQSASSARENLATLNQIFQENTQGVLDWSEGVAEATGRSARTFQGYSKQLGALLVPALDGNREAAAGMATQLSSLAVDLGAFFDLASDDEALVALRAGISGETEPLKRLGVDLTEAALKEFTAAEGMKAYATSMGRAEKIQVRFAKILKDTADAQGAATRESDGYAQQEKALLEVQRDLRTEIGRFLLGPATRFVGWLRRATDGTIKLAKETKIFQTVFVGLAAAVVAWGAKMAIANAHIIAFAAGLAIIALAAEDLYQTLSDPKALTTLGDFLDQFIDREDAFNAFHTGAGFVIDVLRGIVAAAEDAFNGLMILFDAFDGVAGLLAGESPSKAFAAARERWNRQSSLGKLSDEVGRRVESEAQRPRGTTARALRGASNTVKTGLSDADKALPARDFFRRVGEFVMGGPTVLHESAPIAPASGGQQLMSIDQSVNMSITVPPGSSREQLQSIRREVEGVLNERNRSAAAALREQGE